MLLLPSPSGSLDDSPPRRTHESGGAGGRSGLEAVRLLDRGDRVEVAVELRAVVAVFAVDGVRDIVRGPEDVVAAASAHERAGRSGYEDVVACRAEEDIVRARPSNERVGRAG